MRSGSPNDAFVLDDDGRITPVNTVIEGIVGILFHGGVETVLFRQWKAFIAWTELVQFLRGNTSWGEMTRVGFEK